MASVSISDYDFKASLFADDIMLTSSKPNVLYSSSTEAYWHIWTVFWILDQLQ